MKAVLVVKVDDFELKITRTKEGVLEHEMSGELKDLPVDVLKFILDFFQEINPSI